MIELGWAELSRLGFDSIYVAASGLEFLRLFRFLR